MTKEMRLLIALCATSALCFALLKRVDRIRAERRVARRPSGTGRGDGRSASSDTSSSDTFGPASWFSGSDSSSCSCDSSGNPADFGSCGGSADRGAEEEIATVAAVSIDGFSLSIWRDLICRNTANLDRFQPVICGGWRSLESLKIGTFPFASLAALQYLNPCITEGLYAVS
jgi:hypothetical protein